MAAATSEREYKKCAKCKLDKWLEDFYVAPGTGYTGYCTDCRRRESRLSALKHQKQDRQRYNDYMREYGRDWRTTRPKTTRSRLLSDL